MALARVFVLLSLAATCLACAPDTDPPVEHDPLAACAKLGGAAPYSIDEVITRINQLPAPGDLDCFLASLPRPLRVVASSSVFSLQPADGPTAPRIFLMGGPLIMSVVPKGPGAAYLELSERVDEKYSVKGELKFPPEGVVAKDEPYTHIVQQERHCDFCHRDTRPDPSRESAFISLAYKPLAETLVPLSELAALRDECDEADDTQEQCAMLRALFDYGDVESGVFPEQFETFF
jgi:hypothetical protein